MAGRRTFLHVWLSPLQKRLVWPYWWRFKSLHEKENEKYKFVISVYRNDLCHKLALGHVPLNLSKVLSRSLQLPYPILTCKVTGKRVNRSAGYSLEIPVIYNCTGLEKAVAWIQRKKSEEVKTNTKMQKSCPLIRAVRVLECPLIRALTVNNFVIYTEILSNRKMCR